MSNRIFYRELVELDHGIDSSGKIEKGLLIESSFKNALCPICFSKIERYRYTDADDDGDRPSENWLIFDTLLHLCNTCSWWYSTQEGLLNGNGQKVFSPSIYYPVIEKIDISTDTIPLEDLKSNLMRRWDDRKLISAGKAESLVQSILKEYLSCDVFTATANANSPDGGIDLHVCSKDGSIISAVQVKRRIKRNSEPVAEVRDFVGAMVISGFQKGYFVTTADRFSSVAQKVPNQLKEINSRLELELIDGQKLFDLLKNNTKPGKVVIPPSVNLDSTWVASEGNILTTSQLIYGE
ncbi:restriction endonuclease [Vibrio splendidus]|uniref:Restriction endonuclease n=1 Tax=Vibrio splendidus TaxID=29497 RepID=A0A7Y4D926_VIBSP|nr:restriction endonuclease [Vibrio splendidus]NOJ14002.1 restriction endonuclease [Vibrio splendidus]